MQLEDIRALAERLKKNVQQVIVGKDEQIEHLFIALISAGHVLLEDVPGTGKTMMAKTFAQSLDCSFKRVQFTPDLLPADLSGIHYYNQKASEFIFRPGPVFTNILLADEINRATPRTQSSLLECMEEKQVTIDGETKKLGKPFMVIATQNPVESKGTFPLPEAQMDRFMMKLAVGYPNAEEGLEILKRFKENNPIESLGAVATRQEVEEAQKLYSKVFVDDDIMRYIILLTEETHKHQEVLLGVSPRGGQALLKAVQVYALLKGRTYVIPDDIKAMAKPVLSHRLIIKNVLSREEHEPARIMEQVLKRVPVPSEEELTKRAEA